MSQTSAKKQQDQVSEGIENFELPKTLVTKIAKSAIPENAKLQKDVVLSLVKSSTVFINYLAATAHDIAVSKQHKSISASDVLKAVEVIEFGDIVDDLQKELQNYRENSKNDKGKKTSTSTASASTSKNKAATSASAPPAPGNGPLSISITLPPKSKGKGKAKESVSAAGGLTTTASSAADADVMDVDDPTPRNAAGSGSGRDHVPVKSGNEEDGHDMGEIDEDEDNEEEEEEIVDEDEGDEGDEEDLVDNVAVEEEELRRDAKGLDDSRKGGDDDND